MPIDPSIILGVKPAQMQDPLDSYSKSLTLQGLMGQQKLQGLQTQEAQYTLSKMQRDDAAMQEFTDKVKSLGGPDNLPDIADAMIKTGNPQYVTMGVQLRQKAQARQALLGGQAQGQGGGQSPMDPTNPNPSVMAGSGPLASPPAATTTQGGVDLSPRVRQLLAMDDPATTKAAELLQNAEIERRKVVAGRAGAPMWGQDANGNPVQIGFNPKLEDGMTLSPGGLASVVPGYTSSKEILSGVPNPSAAPIKIPLSGGQEAQLTQPEYLAYQKTGALPPRYGSQGSADFQIPPAVQAGRDAKASAILDSEGAPKVAGPLSKRLMSAGLGTPGLTQSQDDLINQERQRAGGKAVDEIFAKDYASFRQGGASDATKQLSQLQDVLGALKAPGADVTGPIRGSLPDWAQRWTSNGQNAIAMRERVEEVVQRSLRAILGSQFTENEGTRLISRAFNPTQPESENVVRVGRLYTQLQQALAAKQDAASYFEKNGTLQGWTGKMPSMTDFDPGKMTATGTTHPDYPGFSIAK